MSPRLHPLYGRARAYLNDNTEARPMLAAEQQLLLPLWQSQCPCANLPNTLAFGQIARYHNKPTVPIKIRIKENQRNILMTSLRVSIVHCQHNTHIHKHTHLPSQVSTRTDKLRSSLEVSNPNPFGPNGTHLQQSARHSFSIVNVLLVSEVC